MSIFLKKFKFKNFGFMTAGVAAMVALALTASCERSDLISGAGNTIIDDLDSALSNPNSGMFLTTIDFGIAEYWGRELITGYSLPLGADPAFSTHVDVGHLMVGVGEDGDTAIAHAQFRVDAFGGNFRALYEFPGDTLVDAYIFFRTTDTETAAGGDVNIFFSDMLEWGSWDRGLGADEKDSLFLLNPTPVHRDSVRSWNCADTAAGTSRAFDEDLNGEKIPCEFTVSSTLDSIKLPREFALEIYCKRVAAHLTGSEPLCNMETGAGKNPEDIDPLFFAITLTADESETLLRLREPYVIVNVKQEGRDNIIRDSIGIHLSRYTVLENEEIVPVVITTQSRVLDTTMRMADARSLVAYSSQLTKRTAVFEINVDTIASIEHRGELLANAMLAIVANANANTENGDDEDAEYGMASINPERFRAIGNYAQLADEFGTDSTTDALSFRRLFGSAGNTPITAPFNVLSVKAPIMESLIFNRDPNTTGRKIYVYLRPSVENTTIRWGRPQKIDVVFSRAREN